MSPNNLRLTMASPAQGLKVGDVVVWEVLEPRRIRVHIIRAAHYETGPVLRATALPPPPGEKGFGTDASSGSPRMRSDAGESSGGSAGAGAPPPRTPSLTRPTLAEGGSSSASDAEAGADNGSTDAAALAAAAAAAVEAAEASPSKRGRSEGSDGGAADGAAQSPKRGRASLSPTVALPAASRQAQVGSWSVQQAKPLSPGCGRRWSI